MKFENYSLNIGNKTLLENVNIEFKEKSINHILGRNGVGKSCLAKSIFGALEYDGKIIGNENVIAIGNYTNIPLNLKVKDVIDLKKKKDEQFYILYNLLNIDDIDKNLKINKLSDGQRQKLKLLFFLSISAKVDVDILILDEFTTALDKKSMHEIYGFIKEINNRYNITIINITHNLTDLELIDGEYWYINNGSIIKYQNKNEIVDAYIYFD